MAELSPEILKILHCPACIRQQVEADEPRHAPLELSNGSLHCARAGCRYEILDGWLPDLVVADP